ncbi:MAG: Endoglucanase precursor [Bacteroidota bacterium]|jgi:hypothetical protein
MKRLILILQLLSFHVSTRAQSIPANRLTDWSNAGYRGTVPAVIQTLDVTQLGILGDSVTDNAQTLNNLITSTGGSLRILYFPAGTYRFGNTVTMNDSVILQGAGADSTRFVFDFGGGSGYCINASGSGNSTWYPVSGGYRRGSDRITASDSGVIQVGDWIEIRQANGTWDTQPISWADYSVGQLAEVNSRNGDTLFLDRPLRINYDSALNVQVSWFTPLRESAIECLSVERRDSASCFCPTVNFYHAVDCAVRGVEGKRSISAHILLDASSNVTVSGSYFHDAFEYNGSSMHGYGIALINHTGQSLIENNILRRLRHSFSLQTGANGNVIAYNYSLEPNRSEFPANYGADISMHGHFPYSNLFEGNIVQNIQLDQTWGPSGPLNTFFRNRAELYGILMSSGTVNSDSQNFAGNEVTSTAAFQGNYALAGTGHFEFGNNVRGVITPAGTNILSEVSLYRTSLPAFWNSSQPWPSIGYPNAAGSGSIPAKERYVNGTEKTVCGTPISTAAAYGVTAQPLSLQVFPNPVRSGTKAIVNFTKNEIVQVELIDLLGKTYRVVKTDGTGQLSLDTEGIANGTYLIKTTANSKIAFGRLVVIN